MCSALFWHIIEEEHEKLKKVIYLIKSRNIKKRFEIKEQSAYIESVTVKNLRCLTFSKKELLK